MKRRKGFVSNSSTSSFVCCVCGSIESGMDLCMSDVDMFQCEAGHCMHFDCGKLETSIAEKIYEGAIDDYDYEVPPKYCPSCKLTTVGNHDLLGYALKKLKIGKMDLIQEIKDKFENLGELNEYIASRTE